MRDFILCKCPIVLAFIAFAALTVILTNTLAHNSELMMEIDELKNETSRSRVLISDITSQISSYKQEADTSKINYDNLKNETLELEQRYIMKLNALSAIIKEVHLKLVAADSDIQYSDKKLLEQNGDFNNLKDELIKNIEDMMKSNTTDTPEPESTSETSTQW